ncbi:MAG: hypothetical protein KF782_22680 [Labilithrix sp.]|nr:hypothetical protein [Labilithrix sp.]
MRKAISFDGIFAAVAVLSVNAMNAGCSKTESATPAPEASGVANAPPPEAPPSAPAVAATPATAIDTAAQAPAVDAGAELRAPLGAPPSKHGGGAACGAQGCSPDMKKGSK